MFCESLKILNTSKSFLFYLMKQSEGTENSLRLSEKVDGTTNLSSMWTATVQAVFCSAFPK